MNQKKKFLTFSYDDGVTQDIRLVELFNKYNMKCTFNLCSELLGKSGTMIKDGAEIDFTKVNREDVKSIYEGHEIAVHTLTHPWLHQVDNDEVIRQVEQDRVNLSEICKYEVVGMAYPGGTGCYNNTTIDLIKNHTGVKYARGTESNFSFNPQTNLYDFNPTVHEYGETDKMFKLGEEFLNLKPDSTQIFYIWGHAYEFDFTDTWAQFEEFLQMMSGRDDIVYCTNKEALLNL